MENMEKKKVNDSVEDPKQPDPEPKKDGAGEKLFTQEEVNAIVEKRIARIKQQGQKSEDGKKAADDEREADIAKREARLACREYIIEKGYSTELLEIIGETDPETFKAKADKLQDIIGAYPTVKDGGENTKIPAGDDISAAFSRSGSSHKPKQYNDYRQRKDYFGGE